MAITFLPEEYTPVGALSKSIQPYLQMAMQAYLQRKLKEPEEKRAEAKEKREIEESERKLLEGITERKALPTPEIVRKYGRGAGVTQKAIKTPVFGFPGGAALPQGATWGEGQITSPTGQAMGEYAPGYEPQRIGATRQGFFRPGETAEQFQNRLVSGRQEYERSILKPSLPTWGQQQEIQSLKTGLRSGDVVLGKQFGEPSKFSVNTQQDALSAIMEAGLDPSLFEDELKPYRALGNAKIVERRISPDNRPIAKLSDKRIIYMDTGEIAE